MRRGDDAAFGVLFERYRRRLIGFAAGMVGDHGRAEDVTQEVFISALRRLRATDAPIAFKPWIYEIARNACIDTFRRSRNTDEVSLDVEDGPAAGVVARLANTAPGPVAALDDKQRLTDLRGAFGGLSDAERDALVLRELEGRSYREIGERLQMRRPAVESTLFRARRKLESEYGELRSGERCRRVQGIVAAAAADGPPGAGEPGARDARRLARHLSHCQPCRRAALAAGMAVDPAESRSLRSRIAGLLPLPAFLRPEGGGLASLAGYAEPAVAWTKALAAAATVTAVGLGAGVAVEEVAGVPLGASPGQALIERATGQGPGEPGWGADGAQSVNGVRGGGATGARDASGARAQDREGSGRDASGRDASGRDASGRDGAASGDAAPGSSMRDAGSPATATAPGAGDRAGRGSEGPGAGREPTGPLNGGGPALPALPDPGDAIGPGGVEAPRLDGLVPPLGAAPEVPSGVDDALGAPGGGAPDLGVGGGLPGGGPQASVPTAPPASVQDAGDTLQDTTSGVSAPDVGLPLRAPEAP